MRLGPATLDLARRGGTIWVSGNEADDLADAVMAVLDQAVGEPDGAGPDDLDRFIREQAATDPQFAAEYVRAQHAATARAYEDLLGDISLYVDWRYLTTKMTDAQKTLWADAHDAWAARMGHEEPSKAERWWAE